MSERNYHMCKKCKRTFLIKREYVKKEWKRSGYDGDYQTYFIKCPECGNSDETLFYRLPYHIMKSFARRNFEQFKKKIEKKLQNAGIQ